MIFYKKLPDGSIDKVDLLESEKDRALASGWREKDPSPLPPITRESPDVINIDYFNNLLDLTEREYSQKRGAVKEDYNTLISQLKQSTELFNKGLESDYGKALENLNVNVYARGVADSGIKNRDITDLGQKKESVATERMLQDEQKKLIASQNLQQKLDELNIAKEKSLLTTTNRASNPYAKYSYTI